MDKELFRNSISIISSRAIYGLNWYNVSPIVILIVNTFFIKFEQSGLIHTAFLLGAALMNIPSGYIANKIGAKNTAMAGMYILSIATILSGFSWDFYSLLFFRFLVGVGAGLYFAPVIKLLRIIFPRERQGFALGLYSAAFNLGAGFAIATWYLVASVVGWRFSLVIAGIVALLITIENHIVLPNDKPGSNFRVSHIFKNKNVLGIAFGCAGFWGAYFTASQFYDAYVVKELNLESSIAGIISSAILITGILGGPLFGFVSDILKKRRTILILLTSAMAIDFIIVPFSGYYLAIFNSFLIGAISAGVFSIMYAVPSLDNSIPNELIPLALGILNSFQIAIGSLIPYVFSFIADNFSFFYAWIFLAIYAIATLPILKMLTVH